MRTKKHYEKMLSENPNTTIGFTLAADMVFTARHDVINRSEDHGGEEWRTIATNLKRKYGENLTVDEVRHEMSPVKSAAAALGSIKSDKKAASSRKNGMLGGRPKEVFGKLYYYDDGQALVEFRRGGRNDWFVWSPKRGQRLATYTTKKELMAAFARSNNTDGGYGCALLRLDVED